MNARLARLRAACAREDAGAFLVRDTSNIRWLTGFDGVFDEEDAHALLVTPDAAVLHTDSRYAQAARAALRPAATRWRWTTGACRTRPLPSGACAMRRPAPPRARTGRRGRTSSA